MVAASPRAERSSHPSSYGGQDKTIQERGYHLRGVWRLVQPPGRHQSRATSCAGNAIDAADLRTARLLPVWWMNSRSPFGGRRRRWRRRRSHPSQGARHAAADGACSRSAPCSRSSPPPQRLVNTLLLQMLEEEAGHQPMRKVGPQLGSPSTPARMMNILEDEGRGEAAARLASLHHEAGGHPCR
jgi:hypothetical protein